MTKQEIRIRLEGIADADSGDAYAEGMFCIGLFRDELPADHQDCVYVSRERNCYVRRTKAGTLIAVVRPEAGRD